MNASDPQFIYMVMILPSLFGLTLVGEGMYKLAHAQVMGIVSLIMGMGFMGAVVAAYFMLRGIV
jgi:hypothetical protein